MATPAALTSAPTLNTNTSRPPSLCMKPLPVSAISSPSATSPPVSLTTKEWVVPPRPKPGRKPATDTPPTKRKAQNRAAQRAFRERRAARVGELEEQMKEVEEQHEQELDALRSDNADLERSLQQCQDDLAAWIAKCRKLEADLIQAHSQISKCKSAGVQSSGNAGAPTHPEAIGCGNCTLESHCQCIDDVVQGIDHTEEGHKDEIRIKQEPSDPSAMEVDFTSAFAKASSTNRPSHTSVHVIDPCGFCQDGTPCICAEMAAEQERQSNTRPGSPMNDRMPTRQLAQFTPPPSEGDVAGLSVPPRATCTSGPGTCAQCIADPNSTLFCKSLAASRGASGCCGGRGMDGGCCQSLTAMPTRATGSRTAGNPNLRLPEPNTRNPITLSCADAYTALSRHAAYDKASGDMASWMPKLHASPISAEDRPAMEIDAANVMAVLKDFDRRFASNR